MIGNDYGILMVSSCESRPHGSYFVYVLLPINVYLNEDAVKLFFGGDWME
jgi:hypothetical protein